MSDELNLNTTPELTFDSAAAQAVEAPALTLEPTAPAAPQVDEAAQAARDAGVPQVFQCRDREEAKAVLPQVLGPDCTVLVKASRGMKLEELTARLLELTAEG